ncbi:MAG: hypothetical protein ACE5FA_08130 [Dehalococcoidia bacterium]
MHRAKWIGRYFGYHRLTFELDRVSMGRLAWVSVLPLAVVVALSISLIASYRLETVGFAETEPVSWMKTFWAAETLVRFGVPLSLAILFASGMQKWSRGAGSWMLMIGLALVFASAGFGAASLALFAFANPQEAFDLRVTTWTQWSFNLALLSVGYFYVAYRAGLNRRPRRRFVRRRLAAG